MIGHLEGECPGRLHVDDEFAIGRLQDRQVGGLRALEDVADVDASLTIIVRECRSRSSSARRLRYIDGLHRSQGIAWRDAKWVNWIRRPVKKGSVPTKSASGRSRTSARKRDIDLPAGAGIKHLDLHAEGAGSRLHVRHCDLRSGADRVDEHSDTSDSGHQLTQKFQPLRSHLRRQKIDACDVSPGRARLATRPSLTGSSATTKMIGIVMVAALAADAARMPPSVTITATRRRTSSAAISGSQSI